MRAEVEELILIHDVALYLGYAEMYKSMDA